MPNLRDNSVGDIQSTAIGTNAGATIDFAAVAGQRHVITDIQGSGDAAALVTIESPVGTALWSKRFAAAFQLGESLGDEDGGVKGASGQITRVKISASTTNCELDAQGFKIIG